MRVKPARWLILAVLALTGMAAAEEAHIEIRAYRVFGPLSGPLWEEIRQRWDDMETARIGLLGEPVQPGGIVCGGLSLHMEEETLRWVGESTTDYPSVLAFGETVARNRQPVTLRLDYPRLAFRRRADGSFGAEMVERGEKFTLTPQLEWQGEELAMIRFWVSPASQCREADATPDVGASQATESVPVSHQAWTNVAVAAKQNAWRGVIFEQEGAEDAPVRYLFVFARVCGTAPPSEDAGCPQKEYTVVAKFLQTSNVTRCRELVEEHLAPLSNAVIQEGALSLYALGGDPDAPHGSRAEAFLEALETDCAAELLSAPRVTITDSASKQDNGIVFKIVLRSSDGASAGVGGGEDDGESGLIAMFRSMHPLLEDSFSRIVQASKKPAVIMDTVTEYWAPGTLAEGVYGLKVHRGDDRLAFTRVMTGVAVLLAASATEAEDTIDVDLCVVCRVKDAPVRGRWLWKKWLPASFPSAASAVHYRHDIDKQPVFLAGPGIKPDEYLLVQVDIDTASRDSAGLDTEPYARNR